MSNTDNSPSEFSRTVTQAIKYAIEFGNHCDLTSDELDGSSYDIHKAVKNVYNVERRDDRLIIECILDGRRTEQVARRTHSHPAEYRHTDVDVIVEIDYTEADNESCYVAISDRKR